MEPSSSSPAHRLKLPFRFQPLRAVTCLYTSWWPALPCVVLVYIRGIIGWHRTVTPFAGLTLSVNLFVFHLLSFVSCRLQTLECVLGWVDVNAACLSPVFKDPHPTCSRCRGRRCSSDSPCSDCHDWSLDQWEMYNKRRSYAERNRPPSHHSGNPTVPTPLPHVLRLPSRQPPHQRPFPTLPPPPLPPRGRCSGKRRAVRTLSEHVCSPLPPCPLASKGRGGVGHGHGAGCGWEYFSSSPPFGGGKDGAILSSATSHSN